MPNQKHLFTCNTLDRNSELCLLTWIGLAKEPKHTSTFCRLSIYTGTELTISDIKLSRALNQIVIMTLTKHYLTGDKKKKKRKKEIGKFKYLGFQVANMGKPKMDEWNINGKCNYLIGSIAFRVRYVCWQEGPISQGFQVDLQLTLKIAQTKFDWMKWKIKR